MNVDNRKRQKYVTVGCFILLTAGFLITRFWQLTTLPYGLHVDEATMSYNAWCIAHYGVDRFLKSWPVYFKNFDGGQSALYTYLCAFCIKIFGFYIWSIRLPGILSSFLMLVSGIKIVKKLFPANPYLPYAAGGLMVICPYFIMASRFGLDCNLALGVSTLFLYLLISAIESGKVGYYIGAGISGGILLYTYALTYIFVPLFLLICFFYLLWTRRLSFRNWLIMAVPLGILALPLILVQVVNLFDLEEMQLGIFTITKMERYRGSELGTAKWVYFIQALISIFHSDSLAYNTVPGKDALYQISIALFFLGVCYILGRFVVSLCKKRFDAVCIPAFWLISILYLECHIIANSNKINAVFFVVVFVIAAGIRVISSMKGILRYIMSGLICTAYFICFLSFGKYYYGGQYTLETHPLSYFDTMFTEAFQFIEADADLSRKRTYMSERSAYFLISALPSPYEFEIIDDISHYGNYYFSFPDEMYVDCNYIVRDIYTDYKEELRQRGFTEIEYDGYSLFYLEENVD